MDSTCRRSRTRRPKKCAVDRLSSLPDDVLHRILASVDFLDVVRTSVLSKRWKHVWTSMPYLNFDMAWFLNYNYDVNVEISEPVYKFWDFVKWAFLLRDESQITSICLSSENTVTKQLNGLLHVAAKLKVPELYLLDGDYTANELEFPRALCETLAVLKLNFRDTIPLRITEAFSSLRSLYLRRVVISSDALEKLLSSDCVKLENVHLEDCQVKDLELINISACNLVNLTIVNVCTCDKFWAVGSFDSKLRICAPKLISFCYIGPMLLGFELVNPVSLKHALIRLLRVPRGYEVAHKNHSLCPARFTGLNHAKKLTLSTLVVKYFSPAYSGLLWDTFMLDNLNSLEVELRNNANYLDGLINLLKCSPNLEALVIRFKEIYQSPRKTRIAIWKSRIEDIACLMYHVKVIQISNLGGSEIELELVKYLLQNGKKLEKMEIFLGRGLRKQQFLGKLDALPKASSKLICFREHALRKVPWFDRGDSDPEYDG